jgi:hypothetical protein
VDTGTNPGWLSEPTQHDRLLYGIGRVREVHVLLDWSLGILQAELAILANPSNPRRCFAQRWRRRSASTDARSS